MRISDLSSDVCSSDLQPVQREFLRHVAQLPLGRTGRVAQVQPDHMGLAPGRLEQAAQHLEGGGFAGAIGTEQAEDLALAYLEAHAVGGGEVAEALGEVTDRKSTRLNYSH